MTTLRTGVSSRKQNFVTVVIHRRNAGDTVGQFERGLEGLRKPEGQVVTNLEAIDNDIDTVFFPFIELKDVVEIYHNAVDPNPMKPAARACSNTCKCSPLRSRTSGASNIKR